MNTDPLITLIGTTLVLIALLVELEHKIIWQHYLKQYHPHKNKVLDVLVRPYRWVYAANVYVLWPLVLTLGLYMLFRQS